MSKTTPQLRLLDDRILVKPLNAEGVSAGGIIIPESAKDPQTKGEVIVTGPGLVDLKMDIFEGEVVMYSQYAGTDLKHKDVEYKVLRRTDVAAILEDEKVQDGEN